MAKARGAMSAATRRVMGAMGMDGVKHKDGAGMFLEWQLTIGCVRLMMGRSEKEGIGGSGALFIVLLLPSSASST